jgi:hypothetical protein
MRKTTRRILYAGVFIFCALILFLVAFVILALVLAFSSQPVEFDEGIAEKISCEPWRQLIPGPDMPSGLEFMDSNNNLDLAQFKGEFYIASRTAPTHFASDKTRIVVLRSADRKTWEYDTEFQVGSDIREPRFLVYKDTLFLYFFYAGTNMIKFEPQGIHVTSRGNDGKWLKPKPVFKPGYVVWRTRILGDKAYMSVYNGTGLYTTADRPGDLRLLVSDNGYDWEPISEKPQVDTISADEGEIIFDKEGNLYATVRLETGGGLVCRADKSDLSKWECVHTTEKYDSALLFSHGDDFYVIARRSVAGPYAAGGNWLPKRLQRAWWLMRYSMTRKRTSLYKLDTEDLVLRPVMDFPSKGDTAFAGIVPLDDNTYWLANYSCPLDGHDWPWVLGQITGTCIYDTILHIER